jgi:hypothetical protein
MRTELLEMKTLVAGVLGIAVVGFGCSDGGSDGNDQAGGSGGVPGAGTSGSGVTGGVPGTGGKASGGTGGSGGSGVTAGSSGKGTGGSAAGTGGSGKGGSGPNAGSGPGGSGPNAGSGPGGDGAGGSATAGNGMGGSGTGGGDAGMGGAGGSGKGGGAGKGGSGGGSAGGGGDGKCTASQSAGKSASGTGPHDVVIETNSDDGIKCGTIFRPADLGGEEKYPIFVWGEGGCSQNGLSNQAAMAEIASWGYFVVADGTPNSTNACSGGQDGRAFIAYLDWAIAENGKSCSAYYQSLETTKIAADGFSCGGLMAENASDDPRFTAIGITSSGLMGSNNAVYEGIHTPFKIMNGGSSDIAYENGLNDYEEISSRGIPIVYFSKTSAGHGGDLGQGRGDFNLVNLAWLNWQLKGDEGATGKAFLHGSTCEFCTDSGWEYMSANIE